VQRPQPVPGSVEIAIFLPEKMPGDIDNRAKAVLDLLVKHKLIDDDRNVRRLVLERDARCVTTCLVDVKARAA
jgi:Holliday junction resolvase RusA-like endonuclease